MADDLINGYSKRSIVKNIERGLQGGRGAEQAHADALAKAKAKAAARGIKPDHLKGK